MGWIQVNHDEGLEVRGRTGGSPCAEFRPPSLFGSQECFSHTTLGSRGNERNQLFEQGHPAASRGDDVTVSSCPGKTQGSNTRGRGQVISIASWQSCLPASISQARSGAKMTRGHACLCSVSLRWPRCPCFLRTTEYHQRVAFWLFHFLEERLPSARIKIECGWCPRNPVQSKHTHVVQWPGGDGADKRNRNVIIALLEVTLRKASGPPLSPSWSCFCQVRVK